MRSGLLGLGIVCLICGATRAEGGLTPTYLRCEYRSDPLGIDVARPRLSWLVESPQRGQRQTAYRVMVASHPRQLQQEHGDLWDTGRVESDETACVVYEGKPLNSHQRCFWKVQVWDKDGNPSEWSKPGIWSMGILDPAQWKAEWIGYDKARVYSPGEAPLDGAKWIWHAADPSNEAPKGARVFLGTASLPADVQIQQAELIATADDSFRFVINGSMALQSRGNEGWKLARSMDVTDRIKPGVNQLRVEVQNATPGPAGLIAKLRVTTRDGKTITYVTDAEWRSTNKPGANWHNREIDASQWPAARVVGEFGVAPWGKVKLAELFLPPVPYLRNNFRIEKPLRWAVLYVTGLGIFDVHCNGKRVSDDYFNPGWTDYSKRVYYRAYDVTPWLQPGQNCLGAILADGWYSGYIGWFHVRDHYGNQPRFRAQLHLEYADGSTEVVATGSQWKAASGPIREADFLMGQTYDARLAMPGWDRPGFDDGKWQAVDVGCPSSPPIQAHPGPAVVEMGEYTAKSITEPTPGVYVVDLGRNFAGVARLRLRGQPGQKIVLRFAERLNPDGTIYTTNLRGARATDTYICRGGEEEVWQPRFTFHGFQYAEITGLTEPPTESTLVGVALSSDTPAAASFDCSQPMLQRLHRNIVQTQRANFIDVPTDCPQRDERLGWTGDAQVYVRTATLNCDVQAFFSKWLVDLEDGQRADGQFPCVAPVKVAPDDGGPAWADAGVICPWTIYEVYGDRRILEKHYPAMTRFIAFCQQRSTPELLPPAKYHCFGDWLSIQADTPKEIIYTAYFAYSTLLTAKAAEVLGKADDAAKYRALYERIKAAFNTAYVKADGRIHGDTQTCYVLALAVDLVDGAHREAAAKYLVENIAQRDGHLSTGFIGTKDLMLVLSKIGRNDVAYRLLYNETFPSWGFSIKHGATSIWERWDGWTPEKGFQTPGMNSFAHYSFGAVYQWMVENMGGIRSAAPGYKQIVIRPELDPKLNWVKVAYRSIRGTIESDWEVSDNRLNLKATVPVNTTATLFVPARDAAGVREGGRPLAEAAGVKFLRMEGGRAVVEVGGGQYHFESTLP